MAKNNGYNYREKILGIIQQAEQPLDPENIRIKAGIANWQTALKHLLELKIEGQIEGIKTSKSWIFWLKNGKGDPNHEC